MHGRGVEYVLTSQGLEYLKLNIAASEVVAAEEYLINSGFLGGRVNASGIVSVIDVRGITNLGINVVENAVDKSKDKELQELIRDMNPSKIDSYLTTCFKYPVAVQFETMVSTILSYLQEVLP